MAWEGMGYKHVFKEDEGVKKRTKAEMQAEIPPFHSHKYNNFTLNHSKWKTSCED